MKRVVLSIFTILLLIQPHESAAMSYEQERQIATEFISWLDSRDLIIYNKEITWTLQTLTDQLADQIKEPVYNYKVYLVRDRSVNAFAIPDGHIFINLGTLLFVKDINELASIIGHEMGHCQLRHIPESFATQNKINIAKVVGILAGTLLSSKNPEIGSALIFSSLGGSESFRLKYSRVHEREADEFSTNILPSAGFDPSGMARFLIRLRTYTSTPDAPEYLLTHPYIQKRIAYVQKDAASPKPEKKFWSLYASVSALLLSEGEAIVRIKELPQPYNRLALGILKVRFSHPREGLTLLNGIEMPQAYAWKGIALYSIGEKEKAIPYLKRYNLSLEANLALADIMEEKGQIDKAINTLLPFERRYPRVAYKIGILYQKSGRVCLAHVAFARYFYYTKNYEASLYHIDKALLCNNKLERELQDEMRAIKKIIKSNKS
ncbi:MAG: M48 family metalloprotease [Deltaproteobacteria bacterium]|nr:M48 family metalloprotease [Deltaproteobacteria bacterium]